MSEPNRGQSGGSASKTVLYREITTRLRERITSGVYQANSKLPSLSELVEEFDVSAISVRRALRELAYEGLVHGEQGRGVFVRPKTVIHRVLAANAERSIGDEIKRAGFVPKIVELDHRRVSIDEEVAARLGIRGGTKIHRHRKMVFANAEPVSLHSLYFSDEVAERIAPYLATTFVFRMLELARFKVHRSRFEFAAMALDHDQSDLFKKAAGFPMGIVHFTPLLKSGKPILSGTTVFRSDRFVFELDSAP